MCSCAWRVTFPLRPKLRAHPDEPASAAITSPSAMTGACAPAPGKTGEHPRAHMWITAGRVSSRPGDFEGTIEKNSLCNSCACLLSENHVKLHFDASHYSSVKWEGLMGSKSENTRWDGLALGGIHSSIRPRRRSKEAYVTSHFIFLNAMWGPTFYFCLSAQIHTQTAYSMIICIKLLICQW